MLLIMKFFDPSCLLRLTVLLTVVLIYIYIHTNTYTHLILWPGHCKYFCLMGKLLQSSIAAVEICMQFTVEKNM